MKRNSMEITPTKNWVEILKILNRDQIDIDDSVFEEAKRNIAVKGKGRISKAIKNLLINSGRGLFVNPYINNHSRLILGFLEQFKPSNTILVIDSNHMDSGASLAKLLGAKPISEYGNGDIYYCYTSAFLDMPINKDDFIINYSSTKYISANQHMVMRKARETFSILTISSSHNVEKMMRNSVKNLKHAYVLNYLSLASWKPYQEYGTDIIENEIITCMYRDYSVPPDFNKFKNKLRKLMITV